MKSKDSTVFTSVYNAHFFPAKTAQKIEIPIIQMSYPKHELLMLVLHDYFIGSSDQNFGAYYTSTSIIHR